jgi:ABC-type transport system involved in multi-copper enzyme maturation permease subunit
MTGAMTAGTAAPYRSDLRPGRDGFAQLLHAEWTKFRTVRGWVIGMLAAALLTVLVGLLGQAGSSISCAGPGGQACAKRFPPLGPDGEPVADRFYFVHQPLSGDGSITVRVTSLTGLYSPNGAVPNGAVPNGAVPNGAVPNGGGPPAGMRSGTQPWSKAGIIIKESTTQGSAYAALMVTGSHGVRMQYDYTQDTAGRPGAVSAASPRWLRLTRSGDTIVGYESADGSHWTTVGTARLAGLPSTVQAGLFAASPEYAVTTRSFGGTSSTGGPTQATARVDRVSLQGAWPRGAWTGDDVGGEVGANRLGAGFQQAGSTFTVSGSGDIAPVVPGQGLGRRVGDSLLGAFAGLIAVIVVGTIFSTAEFRRGLIRTTLAASPRRGRVLAAKAIVIGSVTFVAGLVGALVAVPLVDRLARNKGFYVFPVPSLTELRVITGTAALLAVAAVLALAVGTVLRRSAGAVTAVIVLIVLPYILGVASVLPLGPAEWLLRLTPAAAFSIQQSVPRYPQVSGSYTPDLGYFPLAPWAGFAVLCGYAAAALGLAVLLLRRRDA